MKTTAYLGFLIFSLVSNAWATVDLYVDTDNGSDSNNGSSWSLAFKSCYGAVVAIPSPIAAPYVIHCRGATADTLAYGVLGKGTTAINTITIQTDPSDRHAGVWDDTKYHMVFDNKGGVGANDDFVNFYGIQFNSIYGTAGGHTLDMHPSTNGVQKVAYCIFKATITGNPTDFVAVHSGDYGTLYAWNNVVYGYRNGSNPLLIAFTGYRPTYLYNNTIYSCYTGIYTPTPPNLVVAVNNLFVGVHDAAMGGGGALAAGTDYNATDASYLWQPPMTVTGGDGVHEQLNVNTNGLFVDAGNGNFNLTATGTAQVRGAGQANPGAGLFLDDITGRQRQAPWDIGAFAASSAPATYYCDPANGNDGHDGLSTNTAWRTIYRSTRNLSWYIGPGDTLYLMDGIYAGNANVIDIGDGLGFSGTPDSPITIAAFPGAHPVITDITNGVMAVTLKQKACWTFTGLMWSNIYGAMALNACTNCIISNCVATAMRLGITNNDAPYPYSDYSAGCFIFVNSCQSNRFVGNTVTNWQVSFPKYPCCTNQWMVAGSPVTMADTTPDGTFDYSYYNLFESNVFMHCGHDLCGMTHGWNVIRRNLFVNDATRPTNAMAGWTYYNYGNPQPWPNILGAWGARITKYGGGDNDFTQLGTNYNVADCRTVFEDNDLLYAALPADSNDGAGMGIASRCGIFRRNRIAFCQGSGIYFEHSGNATLASPVATSNPAFYHAGMAVDPLGGTNEAMSTLNCVYNNTVFGNGTMYPLGVPAESSNNIRFPAYAIEVGSPGDINNFLVNNILLGNYPADLDTGADSPTNAQVWGTNWVGTAGVALPRFVSTNGFGFIYNPNNLPDFHLQPGSPCIDAGAWLTTCIGSGSSTTLPVFNSLYFSDGNHVVPGDTIQLQGQTNTAVVLANDWTNNVLTLDRSLSWTNGQGVALAYSGKAPDMGAYESATTNSAPPATPQGGTLNVSGTLSVGTLRRAQ